MQPNALKTLLMTAEEKEAEVVFIDKEVSFDESSEIEERLPSCGDLCGKYRNSPSARSKPYFTSWEHGVCFSDIWHLFLLRSYLVKADVRFVNIGRYHESVFIDQIFLKSKKLVRCPKVLYRKRTCPTPSISIEKDFVSLFSCAVYSYCIAEQESFISRETLEFVRKRALGFLMQAAKLYHAIPKNKRYQPAFLDTSLHLCSNVLYDCVELIDEQRLRTEYQRDKTEYQRGKNEVKQSTSWKIGRLVTYLPRKIKKLIMS